MNGRTVFVVLDLNGVLLARVNKKDVKAGRLANPKFFPKSFDYSVLKGRSKVYVRPYAREFVKKFLDPFLVDDVTLPQSQNITTSIRLATWTSAKPETEKSLLENLIQSPDLLKSLFFRWTRDQCDLIYPITKEAKGEAVESKGEAVEAKVEAVESKGEAVEAKGEAVEAIAANEDECYEDECSPQPKRHKANSGIKRTLSWNSSKAKDLLPIALKPLSKAFEAFPDQMNPQNTIIIDDSLEKMPSVENALIIPEYSVCKPDYECSKDDVLLRLEKYLFGYINNTESIDDVREYLRRHPFPV